MSLGGQMAAWPAGGATRAAWSSGEAGLSQTPRLPSLCPVLPGPLQDCHLQPSAPCRVALALCSPTSCAGTLQEAVEKGRLGIRRLVSNPRRELVEPSGAAGWLRGVTPGVGTL